MLEQTEPQLAHLKETFFMLDRRYHFGHMLGAAFLAAVTIVAVLFFLYPRPAYDATSGSVALKGNVGESLVIEITLTTGYNALDLTPGHAETDKKVADVREASNRAGGYVVTVQSANLLAGNCGATPTGPCLFFDDTVGTEDEYLYFTLENGTIGAITFDTGTNNSTGEWSTRGTKNKAGTTYAANITYTSPTDPVLGAGDYVETLTFTIQAP